MLLIDYNQLTLTFNQKIVFYLSTFTASLILGWLFYDNLLISLFIFLLLKPLIAYYKNYLIEKRKNILLLQFKDLLYSLSSMVSVGRSLGQALEESITFWKGTYDDNDYIIIELKHMVRRMRESRESDISVLEEFAYKSGLEDIKDFAVTCKICKETGADIVKAISNTAEIIGDKITIEKELQTAGAQKRFEGRVVALAPVIMILGIKIFSPEYLMSMTSTFEGRIITTIALILIFLSWTMIERMNKIDF